MNFTYGSYSVFSKVEARRPAITAGLDGYLMNIDIVFTPNNPPQGALIIDDLRLSVSFGNGKQEVGVALPSANYDSCIWLRRFTTGQQDVPRQFRL